MVNSKKQLFKRTLYFVLPVVLLYFIFRKIDIDRLFTILREANPLLILIGIAIRPLQILFGALRWQLLSNHYSRRYLTFSFISYHYWSGLAMGYFTPGNLGWDAYRILAVGKKIGSYASIILAVVAEKLLGLFSVFFMILLIFPFVSEHLEEKKDIFQAGYYIILAVSAILLVGIGFISKFKTLDLFYKFNLYIRKIFKRFSSSLNLKEGILNVSKDFGSARSLLSPIKEPPVLLWSFLLSWGILIIAALCSQIFFMALDFEINFGINLFVAPVFFILFLIPLSFGSIGVREGAFILLFGLFGVPVEIALLVSFLNLMGLLLNNAIGALFIFFGGINISLEDSGN